MVEEMVEFKMFQHSIAVARDIRQPMIELSLVVELSENSRLSVATSRDWMSGCTRSKKGDTGRVGRLLAYFLRHGWRDGRGRLMVLLIEFRLNCGVSYRPPNTEVSLSLFLP